MKMKDENVLNVTVLSNVSDLINIFAERGYLSNYNILFQNIDLIDIAQCVLEFSVGYQALKK